MRNRVRVDGLQVDIRGDAGFVIAPPSLHACGVAYRAAGDWNAPREVVPLFHPEWFAGPRPTARPQTMRRPATNRDVIDRARRYLATIPVPDIGHGSDAKTLYAAARLVRGFGLNAADAEDLLWAWAGGREGWTRAWVAAKVAHALRYGTEPIGSLR